MLRDGLIEKQLVIRVMIAGERRRAIGEGEVESYVSNGKLPPTPHKRYSGVDLEEHMEITDYSSNTTP